MIWKMLTPLLAVKFSFLEAALGAAGKALGAAFGGTIGGNIFGGGSEAGLTTEDKEWQADMVRLGNKLDLRNQNVAYDHRLTRMKEYGLTPVEMFGSPGSAPGGGTTGSGATLGNAAQRQGELAAQQRQEMRLQMRQSIAANMTELQKTKMQTDAQKEIAGMHTGVTERGQDLDYNIAQQTLNLNREKLQLEVKKAASQIGLTKAQTQKTLNEVVTSSAKFQTAMKQLSMGPANLLVEFTLRDAGLSLSDDSFSKMPPAQRKEFLDKLLALSSTTYIEANGVKTLGANTVGSPGKVEQTLFSYVYNVLTGGNASFNPFSGLGNGGPANNNGPTGPYASEPIQYGPNMEYR